MLAYMLFFALFSKLLIITLVRPLALVKVVNNISALCLLKWTFQFIMLTAINCLGNIIIKKKLKY